MNTNFLARPIAETISRAERERAAAGDPDVRRMIADASPGYPCRRCLRDGEVGEAMLLFAHSPFTTGGPYAETGPVFVHERACAAPDLAIDELPEVTRVRNQVVVRAYDHNGAIHDAALAGTGEVSAVIASFFADADVAFAHVRSVTYGCFTYAVERA
jgi:Protein of unknown function (DUF1203)